MKMNHILFLVCLIVFNYSFSQEYYLKVKKGAAVLNSEKISPASGMLVLRPNATLKLQTDCIILVKKGKKLLQLNQAKSYSGSQLIKLVDKQKEVTSSSYVSILFKDQMQKSSNKITYGAASRGLSNVNWQDLEYSPAKGQWISNDSLKIVVFNEGVRHEDSVYLKKRNEEKIIGLKLSESSQIDISNLSPGTYEWQLTLYVLIKNDEFSDNAVEEKESHDLIGSIQIPDENELKELEELENEFKKSIKKYDPEVQSELMIEFYKLHHWCP